MIKLKKITKHIHHMGLFRFIGSVHKWSKKTVKERLDRQLWRLDLTPPFKTVNEPNWITITFGLKNVNQADGFSETFTEEEKRQIILEANKVCQQRFSLLGSDEQDFSEAIPWHTDFKSGYTWPLIYFQDISKAIGDAHYFRHHADIKVPWELSRMQHLIPLGQAFSLSGKDIYYRCFKSQIMDWMDQNPYKLGPNWASTMDVAIRAVNISVASIYFETAIHTDPSFSVLLLNHLKQTGEFIEQNLECDFSGHGNNHYLANLTGLVFLGLSLKKAVPRALKWLKVGIAGLESEMQFQVNEDGGSFEGSLSYHRLSTEMFLFSAVVLGQNGYGLSVTTLDRLERMCEFIQNYIKPSGTAPVIGDADDGRLLMMGTYFNENKRDHRHLLGTAGFFFKRPDFVATAGPELMEMKWIFGHYPLTVHPVERPVFVAYPETGMYILRDIGLYLMIRCGPIGSKGKGGHDHNDQLSFELQIHGCDVVVDPGTFAYTGDREQRQLFRSVAAHNVAQYEALEQNIIGNTSTAELFRMENAHGGICHKAGPMAEGLYFDGSMVYEDSGVSLRRQIHVNYAQRMVRFTDEFLGGQVGATQVERLHLSKDITDIVLMGNKVQLKTRGDFRINLETSAPVHRQRSRISESYGLFYEATCMEWSLVQNGSFTISY